MTCGGPIRLPCRRSQEFVGSVPTVVLLLTLRASSRAAAPPRAETSTAQAVLQAQDRRRELSAAIAAALLRGIHRNPGAGKVSSRTTRARVWLPRASTAPRTSTSRLPRADCPTTLTTTCRIPAIGRAPAPTDGVGDGRPRGDRFPGEGLPRLSRPRPETTSGRGTRMAELAVPRINTVTMVPDLGRRFARFVLLAALAARG